MDKLKDAASFLKTKFQTDEIDDKLAEAVSEENWQASTQLLHQIANASFNFDKQEKIIVFVWSRLKQKSWKKVLKTLHLMDFLLKYGPSSLIDNFKDNVYEIRRLDDYSAKSGGVDQGEAVRKQAKVILVLLTDEQLLNDERAKAKQIKDRMSTVIGSGAYFGQFSSTAQTSGEGNIKTPSYGNMSSQSYRGPSGPSGSSGNGMSFGQSVMRELQEKKGPVTRVQPQKAPSSKLNLNSMMEKKQPQVQKAEPEKKSFNSLSMKLVKPAEKKAKVPVGPGSKASEVVKPVAKRTNQKERGNVDIMDFDFNAVSISDSSAPQLQSNPMDLLGGAPTPQPSQAQSSNSFNLFESAGTQPVSTSTPSNTLLPDNKQTYSNFSLTGQPPQPTQQPATLNYQAYKPPAVQDLSFMGLGSQPQSTPAFVMPQSNPESKQVQLDIAVGKEKVVVKKDEGSLVDFSDFRAQIGTISHTDKKQSIASNWNW